jgi:hypothetical protein
MPPPFATPAIAGRDRPPEPDPPVPPASPRGRSGQAGQATAEYALVLLGAAAVAMLLVGWATHSGAIGHLLDAVVSQLERKLS